RTRARSRRGTGRATERDSAPRWRRGPRRRSLPPGARPGRPLGLRSPSRRRPRRPSCPGPHPSVGEDEKHEDAEARCRGQEEETLFGLPNGKPQRAQDPKIRGHDGNGEVEGAPPAVREAHDRDRREESRGGPERPLAARIERSREEASEEKEPAEAGEDPFEMRLAPQPDRDDGCREE